MEEKKVIVSGMTNSRGIDWNQSIKKKNKPKRLTRNSILLSASFALLAAGGIYTVSELNVKPVMGQMSTGFEYDENIGRLQFVSNILPESAMVFLQTDTSVPAFSAPVSAQETHAWSENEPWLEYAAYSEITSAADGEVMTVVSSRAGEYSVRILHQDGYESICSGLAEVSIKAGDRVVSGQRIGVGAGATGFELRKDGLSVRPVFAETEADVNDH